MCSILNYSKAINMLNLWATPDMWHDKSLFIEVKALTNKLSTSTLQLTERELYLSQELTKGLIEATLTAMNKADDFEHDELAITLNEITQLQAFLLTSTPAH